MLHFPTRLQVPLAPFGQALAAMRAGATLHLQFGRGPLWALDDGSPVSAEVVSRLLTSGHLTPTGRPQSPGKPAQAWKLTNRADTATSVPDGEGRAQR